ncbi:g6939 [Coccomyxa elongata]
MRASATGEMAAILADVDLLREVFLQDTVLKLQEHGEAYKQHFPQLQRIVQHSCWDAFAQQFSRKHARSMELAHPDADRRAAAQVVRDEVRQCLKNMSNVVQSAPQLALLPVAKKRPADDDLANLQQPHKQQRSSPVSRRASGWYRSTSRRSQRFLTSSGLWRAPKRSAAPAVLPSITQISWRMKQGDSEEGALAALEKEMQGLPASKQLTAMQKLNEMYRKRRAT